MAIVSKSGSGKSTLMHLLPCLDAPTESYIYGDGDETCTMSEMEKNLLRNKKFGFVLQQFFLNGPDSVFQNVVFPISFTVQMATNDAAKMDAVKKVLREKGFEVGTEGFKLFVFTLPSIAIVMALVCGTAFVTGVMPAIRASRLNPIESLRYE